LVARAVVVGDLRQARQAPQAPQVHSPPTVELHAEHCEDGTVRIVMLPWITRPEDVFACLIDCLAGWVCVRLLVMCGGPGATRCYAGGSCCLAGKLEVVMA